MGPGLIPDLGTKILGATAQPKTNNNTKTMTKKSVWFVVMSLFILGIVNFIYSLLFIGIDQCSSVFNEPCLKGFFLCFPSYAYLLFHSLLFLFKLTPTSYILFLSPSFLIEAYIFFTFGLSSSLNLGYKCPLGPTWVSWEEFMIISLFCVYYHYYCIFIIIISQYLVNFKFIPRLRCFLEGCCWISQNRDG